MQFIAFDDQGRHGLAVADEGGYPGLIGTTTAGFLKQALGEARAGLARLAEALLGGEPVDTTQVPL